MLIIGERINSTRLKTREAIGSRDALFIAKEAHGQFKAGARILDVNCAMALENEPDDIDWVIGIIRREVPSAGICVDSPNHLAIARALKAYDGKGEIFINSITADEDRMAKIVPLALEYGANLIALVMDESGMPNTRQERRSVAERILKAVKKYNFDEKKLYFDPLIRPLATEPEQADEFLGSIALIRSLGAVKTVCGLSNISFGLPKRSLINASFLNLALASGLDAAIMDPLDRAVIRSLWATEAVSGRDKYCKNYIAAFREGRL